jgi:hypothetical protein
MTFSIELVVEVAGAVMILAAFALNQFAGLDRHGFPYLGLNLVGAVILAVVAAVHGQWGFLLLQGVWAIVALWGVVGLVRREEKA